LIINTKIGRYSLDYQPEYNYETITHWETNTITYIIFCQSAYHIQKCKQLMVSITYNLERRNYNELGLKHYLIHGLNSKKTSLNIRIFQLTYENENK